MKNNSYFFVLLLAFITPLVSFAHVKWFVDSSEIVSSMHKTTPFYSWGSVEVLIWSLIVIVTVFIFSIIDRASSGPKKILAYGLKHEKKINHIAQIILGVFLVSVGFLWKVIIIPEIPVTNAITLALQYIQMVIGLMFIMNVKPKWASIGLMAFCLGLMFSVGVVAFLENAMLLSLAIYFFIVNSKEDSKAFILNKHAVEIVRIGTGISLIVLAFTEKLLYPELSLQFLEVHNWNFMQGIFPWFTNELFVLSTGFAEMIFGILFIFGYITRVTTLLIAFFFGVSVTTMLIEFNAWEVEDLVVYSAAILFIFYGHGKTKFFHFMWPNSSLHKSIIKLD